MNWQVRTIEEWKQDPPKELNNYEKYPSIEGREGVERKNRKVFSHAPHALILENVFDLTNYFI